MYLTREDDKELSTRKVEDLDSRCKMKKRLIVIFLYQYIKINLQIQDAMEHKYGMQIMKKVQN